MSSSRRKIRIDKQQIARKMKQAGIHGISIAAFDENGPTDTIVLGVDHKVKTDFYAHPFFRGAPLNKPVFKRMAYQNELTTHSVFRAASLSKPVFAYLVLKLIENNKTDKAKSTVGKFKNLPAGKQFNLDTPLYEVYPEMLKKFNESDQARAQKITARMVLSHQSGLPGNDRAGYKFLFEPEIAYGYSNVGIALLQEVIDKLTGSNLQVLAKANIFDDANFNMTNTYFLPPVYLTADAATQLKEMQLQIVYIRLLVIMRVFALV